MGGKAWLLSRLRWDARNSHIVLRSMHLTLTFLSWNVRSKAVRRGDRVFACVVRPLAGGEEEPPRLSPIDESATAVDNAGPKAAAIQGEFADVFSDRLPKDLPPRRAIEHTIDLLPDSKPTARLAYKISFAEQADNMN